MASSLATHFTSFLFVFPIGIRRLVSSSSIYLNNPSLYRSKTWYFSNPKWKNVDFITLLIVLPIASFSQFFLFLAVSGHPTYKFSILQQSSVVFLFWVLLILIGINEFLDPVSMPDHFIFVFAGVAFLIEYLMNGNGFVGVGQLEYSLLGGLTLVCASSCFFLSIRPSAYFADFFLSCGLISKGIWVLQIGLTLFTDSFSFKGCGKVVIDTNVDVKCDLDEDKLRGIALMNLLFIGHLIMVLLMSFVILGLLSCKKASSCDLSQLESDHMLIPVLEMEFEI